MSAEAADVTTALVQEFFGLHPEEAAQSVAVASPDAAARVLDKSGAASAARVVARLSPEAAASVLEDMDADRAAAIVTHLDPVLAAALLSRLDDKREQILDRLPGGFVQELRTLMSYPAGSAGSIMDPRVHTFRPEVKAAEAIDRLRRTGRKRVYEVFVVNEDGKLEGVVPLQSLAVAAPEARLDSLTEQVPVSVLFTADREEVADLLDVYPLVTLPVVDMEGRMLGVVRHHTLMETVEQDATSDIQSMVGAGKEERALSSIPFAVRKRLPWLQINLATAFLAASVVGLFEDTIAKFTALAVLLPVVAGQSGNTGSQALAVTLRGLALREIRINHWPRVSYKEAFVGAINGLAVAAVTSLGVFIWSGSAGLMMVIGLAMVISMAIAGVTGALIPMILAAIGQDPAQSSSIILTTVTDIAGFFSFLGLATLFSAML